MSDYCNIFSLEGKVVVVTGGTRRYGYHFCEVLAEAGGTIVLTSRDQKRADEIAERLRNKGLRAFGYSLQLAEDESIEKFVSTVIQDHGKIDVLVNSARTSPQMPANEINREELDKVFTINCAGLILLTRRVVEEMKKAGGGNIINIGSVYGMGGQDPSIYREPERNISLDDPITKGGTATYTKQLATTLAQYNIRANCLVLGGLHEATHDPYFEERYNKRTPLGRMATGEDVKGPIVFLASDASAYMTGASLVVDGGWTAW